MGRGEFLGMGLCGKLHISLKSQERNKRIGITIPRENSEGFSRTRMRHRCKNNSVQWPSGVYTTKITEDPAEKSC